MITIIYGSSRKGNTELLAEKLLEGIDHKAIYLRDLEIEHIEDRRHDDRGFDDLNDAYYQVVKDLLDSETIIFATPLYWYGMSDLLKKFISRFSESMRDRSLNFKDLMKDKQVYSLIVGGDQARIKALPLVQQFKYICEFLEMDYADYLIGQGNEPGDVLEDQEALLKAKILNERLS